MNVSNLSITELQQRMGQAATRSDAENMQNLLAASEFAQASCVEEIPEDIWLEMLNQSIRVQI